MTMPKRSLQVIKIGGNIINDKENLSSFILDFSRMEGLKILIHGGGNKATEMANDLGLQPKMIGGRRITDEANLDIVTMVYAGLLNKNIVSQLQFNNCNAIGLSGADANCIQAHKRVVKDIDYGFAGDVDEVNSEAIKLFLENKMIPVFCAITHDTKGQLLNTNADTISSEIAKALSNHYKVELVYCFEKNGVLEDVNHDNSVIEQINIETYKDLKKKNIIAEGMLPKLKNCFEALENGVSKVIIGNPKVISDKNQKYTTLTL
jgi:acetylglutamate kinase